MSHPDGLLRGYVAEYLGRGWHIRSLDVRSALLSRRKRTSRAAWLVINPLYLLKLGRTQSDEVRVSVGPDGELVEESL